jgi:hypothetical protein
MRGHALWQRIAKLSEEHDVSSLIDLRIKTLDYSETSVLICTRLHGFIFQNVIIVISLSVRLVSSYMAT